MTDRTPRRPDRAPNRPDALLPLAGAALAGLAALEMSARRRIGLGQPYATVRRAVAVAAPPEQVYAVLSDPEGVALLLGDGDAVRAVSANRWAWRLPLPAALPPVTMSTSVVDARPGRQVSWRTTNSALVPHEVQIALERSAADGETVVHGAVELFPSRLLPLAATARPLEFAADAVLATALFRLRALLETREIPTTDGQPRGRPDAPKPSQPTREESMTDDGKRGLGRVVYSVDPEQTAKNVAPDELSDGALVKEASEESFPASDAPAFARGAAEHTTDPDPSSEG